MYIGVQVLLEEFASSVFRVALFLKREATHSSKTLPLIYQYTHYNVPKEWVVISITAETSYLTSYMIYLRNFKLCFTGSGMKRCLKKLILL
jgi:hypothetical protein